MGAPRNLEEVELFLKNMFNDKNIITTKSSALRSLISFMITQTRKNEAKENYKLLGGKSPLVEKTKELIHSLQERLQDHYVTCAMRYTPPFSDEVIQELKKREIKDILLFPLYPQYSTTTTKSSVEDFLENAKKLNLKAKIKIVEKFYDDPLYNKAIITQIKKTLQNKDPKEFDLIFSAHSLPVKIVQKGDPYEKEVKQNIEILQKMLQEEDLAFGDIHLAYQSKLGPVKWLEPSLEEKLKSLKNKKVLIYPISFVLDNSETLYELHMEYAAIAKKLNFQEYSVCNCPNSDEIFIDFLINKIKTL